ncbi:MAG: hypothetical protein H7Y12_02980 [Sphingobacteriaceae bacterium]|nr:hypothetical protein [Cytophagaceae bacterium]
MRFFLLWLLSVGLSLTRLVSAQTLGPQDELDIRTTLEGAIRALEAEDSDGLLAILDPASPLREQAGSLSKSFFGTYDLRYELESIQPGNATPDGVEVRTTLLIRRIGGAAFRDVRATALGLMRKTAEGWKLYTGRVEKREQLK